MTNVTKLCPCWSTSRDGVSWGMATRGSRVETVRTLDRWPPWFHTQFSPHEGSAHLLQRWVLPQTLSSQGVLPHYRVDLWLPQCSPLCSVPLWPTINSCSPSAESHYEREQPDKPEVRAPSLPEQHPRYVPTGTTQDITRWLKTTEMNNSKYLKHIANLNCQALKCIMFLFQFHFAFRHT